MPVWLSVVVSLATVSISWLGSPLVARQTLRGQLKGQRSQATEEALRDWRTQQIAPYLQAARGKRVSGTRLVKPPLQMTSKDCFRCINSDWTLASPA